MALSSLNTNWIGGSYEADRDFLLKVAENNPLFRHPSNTERAGRHRKRK